MKIPELLCPAGDLSKLKTAVDFGADAVYLAGEEFGMRTASANFNEEDLAEGISYAHTHGVKVHVACNVIPHEQEIARMPAFLEKLDALGADAIIASDIGTISLIKKHAPHCDLHISVQSGTVNSVTANAFYEIGAKRVVLARELSLKEIQEIRDKTNPNLELEVFVHGAMCISFSARCLLSSYMTGRDANRGDCAQPCRWRYSLMEEKRPGMYFDVTETEKGTYIMNANDLCMADHLDQLAAAGVASLKIEGRAKNEYYVAVTTNAYRSALNSLAACKNDNWTLPEWISEELLKISHRNYSTGFYFDRAENAQTYNKAGSIQEYAIAALVTDYKNGQMIVQVKNKFLCGQTLDCIEAGKRPFPISVAELFDEKGCPIAQASHPMSFVRIPYPKEIRIGSVLRMKL